MKPIYETAAGLTVQAKRILKGNYNQTRYTKYVESIEKVSRDELKSI